MSLRNYNKLYIHTDREEGSEKLLLGYRNDTRESLLFKDKETYFHIPFYTKTLLLNESNLVANGATGGPFPAAADRIFKSLGGYGNITANGTPSEVADGGWFCSWLYKDEKGNMVWMDRFYNPGQFSTSIAAQQLEEGPPYISHNPIYRDVPSQMKFESGVLYKYFHLGEQTAESLVTTFGGISGERLPLNLAAWGSTQPDASINLHPVKIFSTASEFELYGAVTESTEHIYAPTISFDHNKELDIQVDYSPTYGSGNEFTLAMWAESKQWKSCQSTQLVGNYTSKGGFGLFIDTLSSFPFFIIPETGYGHLLYVNEKYSQFLDKSVQYNTQLTATPKLIGIDSENNVIACFNDDSRFITKYDNVGEILNLASIPSNGGELLQLLCGPNDTYTVITAKRRFTFDTDLNITDNVIWNSLNSITSYAYNSQTNFLELVSYENVLDSKFIETTNFLISADGNLYKKREQDAEHIKIAELNSATTFNIDPYDRLWVMHGTNDISVFDSSVNNLSQPIFKFSAGENTSYSNKNISFICAFDRETNTRQWNCVIYCSSPGQLVSPQLLVYDMKGLAVKVVDILSMFDLNQFRVLRQQQINLNFSGVGDFTGYERKRVFNKLSPYNNTSQVILKVSLRDRNKQALTYQTFKSYTPLTNWDNNSWNHFIITLENKTFTLYINGIKQSTLNYSGQYDLSYETQPTLFIGSPAGSKYGFNKEIAYPSAIFNGKIEYIKIYNYAMNPSNFEMFLRASIPAQDVYWTLPTPVLQYVEQIERLFKNKIPGAKSSFFNIKLRGTEITDPNTRAIIEEEIRTIVAKIKPVYVEFLKVTWID